MMWKDDIQDEIKKLEKDIATAERRYKSSGMEYYRGYIATMKNQLEAFKNLEPKAPIKQYGDRLAAALRGKDIKGSKSWLL